MHGRLILLLKKFLEQHFDTVSTVLDFKTEKYISNDTLEGMMQKIHGSEVDVGLPPSIANETLLKSLNYAYPYRLRYHTFVT